MTYQSDPTRWTQSHGDAPELLRGAFDAGTREGPSDLQMRALALKLAAVGGGAAIAAGASTAHASATAGGGAMAAAGGGSAFTFTKLAVSIALIGAAATGTVLWQRGEAGLAVARRAAPPQVEQALAPGVEPAPSSVPSVLNGAVVSPATEKNAGVAASTQAALGQAPGSLPADLRSRADEPRASTTAAPVGARAEDAHSPSNSELTEARSSTRGARRSERREPRNDTAVSSPNADRSGETVSIERVTGQRQQVSEIELLRSARSALAARPREAYKLTEEHRSLYPQGVFTQERDALAVEALVRAGDLKLARELAEAFVKRYPSSPHAHRFRESMKLP